MGVRIERRNPVVRPIHQIDLEDEWAPVAHECRKIKVRRSRDVWKSRDNPPIAFFQSRNHSSEPAIVTSTQTAREFARSIIELCDQVEGDLA
jgi:hypothetical protein